jgi:hypothetical protein
VAFGSHQNFTSTTHETYNNKTGADIKQRNDEQKQIVSKQKSLHLYLGVDKPDYISQQAAILTEPSFRNYQDPSKQKEVAL